MAPPRGLATLARLHGLQTAYRANDGTRVDARPEPMMAVLRALGVPIDSAAAIPRLLEHRRRQLADRVLEPVVTATVPWSGDGGDDHATATATARSAGSFLLRLPRAALSGPAHVTVILEEGGERQWTVDPGALEVDEAVSAAEHGVVAVRVPLPALPPGYHDLVVEAGRGRWRALLIAAPARAAGWDAVADGPSWGLFAPLHALWREADPSATPDFALLDAVADRAAGLGGSVVGTLPLLAAFLDQPYEPSPYAPVSRLFWNELYTDPAAAPGAGRGERGPSGGDGVGAPDRYLDPGAAMAEKRPALEAQARQFFADGDPPDLEAFRARHPRVDDYARFRALTERHGGWRGWPDRLRGRDVRSGDYDLEVARYHLYVQWLAEWQLTEVTERARARGVSLYLDLPMGVHGSGYDVWRDRTLFARGASAGAPPDMLAPQGQDWGFPPLRPEASRLEGHRYFVASIRNHLRFARVLRIDHVMQIHRMYWVPGGDAGSGVYVRYPAEELYAILCLESRRAGAVIVGEDLGTVPRAVRRGMRRHGLPGMYVAEFEASGPRDDLTMPRVPKDAIASIGTHDTPTFAGWWESRERDEADEADEGDAAESEESAGGPGSDASGAVGPADDEEDAVRVLESLHDHMGRSAAGLVLATMEDLWLEREPQNVPGTTAETNWRRRSARPVESLDRGRPAALLRRLDNARREAQ